MGMFLKRYYHLLGIALLVYFAFLTTRAIYKNAKANHEIERIKTEIETLGLEKQNLQDLIAYYQTPSFREKEVRRKLGLVKPDEKMVVLSKEMPPSSKKSAPSQFSEKPQKANYQLWWEFFFGAK